MEDEPRRLRNLSDRLKGDYERADQQLKDYVRTCKHMFGETKYDPIYTPSRTIPGDKPGTMGVDFQGPTFVSATTQDRWKRECGICGLVEYTIRVNEETVKKPIW